MILFLSGQSIYSQKKAVERERLNSEIDTLWNLKYYSPHLAKKHGWKAEKIAIKLNDKSNLAKTYNMIGVVYRNLADYDSSFIMYKKALSIAQLINDSTQIAYSYNNIGAYWGYKNKYFLSLKNIFTAREYFVAMGNKTGIAFSDIQAGIWLRYLTAYDKALFFLEEALKIRVENNDFIGIAIAKSRIVEIYIKQEKFALADSINKEVLNSAIYLDDSRGKGFALSSAGLIQLKLGNLDSAKSMLRDAIKFNQQIDYYFGVQQAYNRLAAVYIDENNFIKAKECLKNSQKFSKGNFTDEDIEVMRLYLKLYERLKDYEKYMIFSKKYYDIIDSLDVIEKKSQLDEFEQLFELSKVKNENIKLQEDIQNKDKIIFVSIFFVLIFTLLGSRIAYLNKQVNKDKKLLTGALATKDKLFSIVAHDLKNPFSSLLGYSEFLLEDFDNFERNEIKNSLLHMRASIEKLLQMVENLLSWARTQTGEIQYKPETLKVDSVILETIEYYTQSAKSKNIDFKMNFKANLNCYCDKSMMETVLRNLINNAIKFTDEGGKILLRTNLDTTGEFIEVYIEDNGRGIEKSKLNKIFEENNSTDGTLGEKGTALGLKLVKEMVEKNKGKVEVQSEVNKGTVFMFTVPKSKSKFD